MPESLTPEDELRVLRSEVARLTKELDAKTVALNVLEYIMKAVYDDRDEAVRLLREVEWKGDFYDSLCPVCADRFHHPDCQLGLFLTRTNADGERDD